MKKENAFLTLAFSLVSAFALQACGEFPGPAGQDPPGKEKPKEGKEAR